MELPPCKRDDWNKWANGQCDSSKKSNFMKMKDWSWNQISGFEGEDRLISDVPIVFLCQNYSGQIKTKTIQIKKNPITLLEFIKHLEMLFYNKSGDQSLIQIQKISNRKEVLVLWLSFDS